MLTVFLHVFIILTSIVSKNDTIKSRTEKKPNVIVFIADDFGYGSTNIYGAQEALIKTPNVNKLAKEGVKFTNAYTTGSVCTPTRYALLTGQYSWRTRLKKGVVNMNDPALIDVERKTEASKAAKLRMFTLERLKRAYDN